MATSGLAFVARPVARIRFWVLMAAGLRVGAQLAGQLEVLEEWEYPINRIDCDTRDIACMAGSVKLGLEFEQRTETPYLSATVAEGMEPLDFDFNRRFLPPPGVTIDYSGGIKLPPQPYEAPDSFLTPMGSRSYVVTDVTVSVLTDSFEPADITIQPGSTVTFQLHTFETVRIKSRPPAEKSAEKPSSFSFDSGSLNRNWAPEGYKLVIDEPGVIEFENIALESWQGRYGGRISVSDYNCSSYATCTSCLIYPQCIWCSANATCLERNITTNMPMDTGVVVKVPYVEVSEDKAYENAKYMLGYNARTVRWELNWYPWPPVRKNNPKPIDLAILPAFLTPTSSDKCWGYLSTRDASQCPDYKTPPPMNRVHGKETPNRPSLLDWFACYEHLAATWTTSELPEPQPFTVWPQLERAEKEDDEDVDEMGDVGVVLSAVCCSICSSCNSTWLHACNISCPLGSHNNSYGVMGEQEIMVGGGGEPGAVAQCPAALVHSGLAASLAMACPRVTNCSRMPDPPSRHNDSVAEPECQLLRAADAANASLASAGLGVMDLTSSILGSMAGDLKLDVTAGGMDAGDEGKAGGREGGVVGVAMETLRGRRLDTEYVPIEASDGWTLAAFAGEPAVATRAALDAARSGLADWNAISVIAEAGMLDELWHAGTEKNRTRKSARLRRLRVHRDKDDTEENDDDEERRLSEEEEFDGWAAIPKRQVNLIQRKRGIDLWATLHAEMRRLYGHRCNATMGCDLVRGTCLNISGLPLHLHDDPNLAHLSYDQNGTCTCHPWYEGEQCTKARIDGDACVGMENDKEQCARVRDLVYTCGPVETKDALPDICEIQGLSVLECGERGHMKGRLEAQGVDNMIGRPEQGWAANVCGKCMKRGEMVPETYAKLCDPAIVLKSCQRHEDVSAQRLCNYCTQDTQGSVLPGRGKLKECSFFRGTCMGSVERRIRGVVPPNADIVGHNPYGGLRYCKRPAPFTMQQHYLTENDIMMVGQACIDHTAYFTNWDFTRQKNNEKTVKDRLGHACLEPDNRRTCPLSRNCVSEDLCPEDNPDFTEMDTLIDHWGMEVLKSLSDQAISGEAAAAELAGQIIEFTFESHKHTLTPSDTWQHANWPYIDAAYGMEYTRVTWSIENRIGFRRD